MTIQFLLALLLLPAAAVIIVALGYAVATRLGGNAFGAMLLGQTGVVSLAQAALNTQDDLDSMIIDEFRKSSAILDALVFHDAVNPMGGGSTLTYGYHRVLAQRGAAFRAVNNEYTPAEATKVRFDVDLKPLGGSFQIDRVLAQVARGAEVSFQLEQLIKATRTKFQDEVINGDTAVDANGFDGLDKALTGTDTELNADGALAIDWSDLDTVASTSQRAYDRLDELLGVLDGPPTLLLTNDVLAARLRAIARRANVYVERPIEGLTDAFGNPVNRQFIGNATLVDVGEKAGSTERIIPIYDPDSSVWVVTNPDGADGGTFKLTVTNVDTGDSDETAAIAWNADGPTTIEAAIVALDNVGAGDVEVTGASSPWTITFAGDLAAEDMLVEISDQSVTDGGVAEDVTIAESADVGGVTDLYVVRIGMDAFHGVSVSGQQLVNTWLPDFERAGAVKTGEVEMGPVAVALKATKAAGVLRRIKVR